MKDHKNPLWYCLKRQDQEKLAELYKAITGDEFIPPTRDGKLIRVDTKLEDLEEIDRLMRQKPNPKRGPIQ